MSNKPHQNLFDDLIWQLVAQDYVRDTEDRKQQMRQIIENVRKVRKTVRRHSHPPKKKEFQRVLIILNLLLHCEDAISCPGFSSPSCGKPLPLLNGSRILCNSKKIYPCNLSCLLQVSLSKTARPTNLSVMGFNPQNMDMNTGYMLKILLCNYWVIEQG